jgi:ABC-type transport system involved in cytochrome c biogenesis permease subunit
MIPPLVFAAGLILIILFFAADHTQVDLEPQMAAGLVFLVVMGTLTVGLYVYFGAKEASGVGEGTAYADDENFGVARKSSVKSVSSIATVSSVGSFKMEYPSKAIERVPEEGVFAVP